MSDSVATPCIVAHQAPPSMGFPRQEYWNGLLFPSLGDLPDPGNEPTSPVLAGGFFTTEPPGDSCCSVTQSCPTLCDPMDCSTQGFPVHHQLLEPPQIHVYHVDDGIQPSRLLLFPSPPAYFIVLLTIILITYFLFSPTQ